MKNRTLTIKLNKKQISLIRAFLLEHNIKCDFKTRFGLIAEPRINKDELVVKLLSVNETVKLNKIFKKMGLYENLKNRTGI